MCYEQEHAVGMETCDISTPNNHDTLAARRSILVATPATDDKKINVYQFPEEKLRYIIPSATTADTGE